MQETLYIAVTVGEREILETQGTRCLVDMATSILRKMREHGGRSVTFLDFEDQPLLTVVPSRIRYSGCSGELKQVRVPRHDVAELLSVLGDQGGAPESERVRRAIVFLCYVACKVQANPCIHALGVNDAHGNIQGAVDLDVFRAQVEA